MCKYVYVYICIYLYVYTLTQSHSQTLSSPYVLPSEEEPQTVSFLWIDTQQAKTNGCHSIWAGRNKPYIVINLECSCVCSWKTQVFVMFFCACLPSRTLPVDYVHFFKRELFDLYAAKGTPWNPGFCSFKPDFLSDWRPWRVCGPKVILRSLGPAVATVPGRPGGPEELAL